MMDRISLCIVATLSTLFPRAEVIPSTPWEQLTDDPEIMHRVAGDSLYYNRACKAITGHSLGQVCTTVHLLALCLSGESYSYARERCCGCV